MRARTSDMAKFGLRPCGWILAAPVAHLVSPGEVVLGADDLGQSFAMSSQAVGAACVRQSDRVRNPDAIRWRS